MKKLLISVALLLAGATYVMATTGYVDDEIKVWTRTGPSNEFKVKFKLSPGTPFKILQRDDVAGFVEIQEANGRTSWLNVEYLSEKPTAHRQLDDANKTITSLKETYSEKVSTLEKQLRDLVPLQATNANLQNELAKLQTDFEQMRQEKQVSDGRFNSEMLFSGAIVLLAGMLLGWILSRLGGRNRNSSWS